MVIDAVVTEDFEASLAALLGVQRHEAWGTGSRGPGGTLGERAPLAGHDEDDDDDDDRYFDDDDEDDESEDYEDPDFFDDEDDEVEEELEDDDDL